jgi:hypothetical protein
MKAWGVQHERKSAHLWKNEKYPAGGRSISVGAWRAIVQEQRRYAARGMQFAARRLRTVASKVFPHFHIVPIEAAHP